MTDRKGYVNTDQYALHFLTFTVVGCLPACRRGWICPQTKQFDHWFHDPENTESISNDDVQAISY